jgi:type IV fimbrial biogenesis protein FimT
MQARGFTLIEMLTVVTISAILVAMAVPSFAWVNARTRAANTSNSLLASFELARSEAIRRNMRVSVCRVEDPALAQPVCSSAAVNGIAGDDWGTGWVVFAKTGGADPANFEPNDTVLRVEQFVLPAQTRNVVQSNAAPQFYSFRGDGMSLGSGGPIGITFAIDYRSQAVALVSAAGRCIAFNMTGRARSYAPVPNQPPATAC